MTMTASEKLYVRTAVIVIGLAIVWLLILNPLRMKWQDRNTAFDAASRGFSDARAQIRTKEQLDKSVAALEKELGLTTPTGTPDAQISNLVKQMEMAGGKNGVQFKSLSPRGSTQELGKRSFKPGSKISFRTSFEVGGPQLVSFLASLDTLPVPVVVEALDIRNEPTQPGRLKVSLDCHSYIFHY